MLPDTSPPAIAMPSVVASVAAWYAACSPADLSSPDSTFINPVTLVGAMAGNTVYRLQDGWDLLKMNRHS